MPREALDTGTYTFIAHHRDDGATFIMAEPDGKGLDAIGTGCLSIRLRPGTGGEQAEELARQLNAHVEALVHVRFDGPHL